MRCPDVRGKRSRHPRPSRRIPLNIVFISPNFPPQYQLFCSALRERGVNVLGIGDAPFHDLHPDLRSALTDYVHVPRMEHYPDMLRAVGYLTWRHGRIDRIDSLNEHWLPVDARLREDFNVFGLRPAQTERLRRKSGMAEIFRAAGIPAPDLEPVANPLQVRSFVSRVGLPVVFKPDIGVGAAGAFKVATEAQLEAALALPLDGLVVQRFSPGQITTYDGVTDADGTILFESSLVYGAGTLELLTEALDVAYWTRRDLPPQLSELGRRIVAAFGLRERFFHVELFEQPDGSLSALEVNIRPPGGFTTDMMNWSCDTDVYRLWAAAVTGGVLEGFEYEHRYFCAHLARRRHRPYRLSHDELVRALGPALLVFRELPPPISGVMGEQVYLVRYSELADLEKAVRLVGESPLPGGV